MKPFLLILLLTLPLKADPVFQDPPGVIVTQIETCICEEDSSKWPWLFLALTPLAFIDYSDKLLVPLVPEEPPKDSSTPEPVPEPMSLSMALLGLLLIAAAGKARKR